jgi:hypothetical protein
VSVFAGVRDLFEMKSDGSGFQVKSRLNTFINLPELAQLWRTVLNVRTAEQLALPHPTLVTGKPIVVSAPCSRALQRLTQQLVGRVDRIKNGAVDPRIDNMLKITSEARLAALDTRLLIGGPEAPRCKINALIDRVARLYHTYHDAQATQLIFCGLATPKGKCETPAQDVTTDMVVDDSPAPEAETATEARWNNQVYHEIRAKLARRGVPAEEVAFIHDYSTRAKRDELFAAMNAGTIRVLIGSTNKMGTGMNVQRRLIALHHLDAPWRPGDVEQRDGRILRQGNLWPEVYIFHYVTEHSFDGYLWQLLENKARFIGQVMTGEVTTRMADDVGDTVLTAAMDQHPSFVAPRTLRLRELPVTEMPRTRLLTIGPNALADAELLAILLRSGIAGANALDLARQLLADHGGWTGLLRADVRTLCQQSGIGAAKAAAIKAALEIARRVLLAEHQPRLQVKSPTDIAPLLMLEMGHLDHEQFRTVLLDTKSYVQTIYTTI